MGNAKKSYPVREDEELEGFGAKKEMLAYNRSNLYRFAVLLTFHPSVLPPRR
jgi:hypothetical protein